MYLGKVSAGRNYAIWKVTDLEQTSMTVFMFGAAYDDHFRETEGMVVALVAPKTRTEGGEFALTVDRGDQVWVLGRATDFGYCKAQRKVRQRPPARQCIPLLSLLAGL